MSKPVIDLVYRRLDEHGDMTIGEGERTYKSNLEAITQAIYTRLQHLYGEWWENREDGLPLWQEILGCKQTEERRRIIDLLLVERISATKGVTAVRNANGSFENRRDRSYAFACEVETIYGTTKLEVVY